MLILVAIGILIVIVVGAIIYLALSPASSPSDDEYVVLDEQAEESEGISPAALAMGAAAGLFALIGIAILIVWVVTIQPVGDARFFDRDTWPQTTGTVTNIRTQRQDNTEDVTAYYQFTATDGTTYSGAMDVATRISYDEGESVTVRYWPGAPDVYNHVLNQDAGRLPSEVGILAVIAFAVIVLGLGGSTKFS